MVRRIGTIGTWMAAGLIAAARFGEAGHPVPFDVQFLTVDANEGCDVADIDGDGRPDISAGRNWYRNGDWIPRPLRQIEDWNGYVHSNGEFLYDVNGDGRMDVVAGSFIEPQVHWYENPGEAGLNLGQMWPKHLLADTGFGQNEAAFFHDLDGDGTPEYVVNSWNKGFPMLAWKFAVEDRTVPVPGSKTGETKVVKAPVLTRLTIGEKANGHGIGFGDLNNDGREDILVGTGWYERPEGDLWAAPWEFHADWNIGFSCPVLVRDLDGDGLNDVIWAKGHDFGLYVWFGRGVDENGKLKWDEKLIDDIYSQAHCLHFADLDGDGQDELITGKRYRAHNDGDPGGKEPPIFCYYSYDKKQKLFERHIIDEGRAGIGLQIRTTDLDGDGDLDIVAAGKDGTKILWNRRVEQVEQKDQPAAQAAR